MGGALRAGLASGDAEKTEGRREAPASCASFAWARAVAAERARGECGALPSRASFTAGAISGPRRKCNTPEKRAAFPNADANGPAPPGTSVLAASGGGGGGAGDGGASKEESRDATACTPPVVQIGLQSGGAHFQDFKERAAPGYWRAAHSRQNYGAPLALPSPLIGRSPLILRVLYLLIWLARRVLLALSQWIR
jgi:hypothetical protein